jgi:hypothetical protein
MDSFGVHEGRLTHTVSFYQSGGFRQRGAFIVATNDPGRVRGPCHRRAATPPDTLHTTRDHLGRWRKRGGAFRENLFLETGSRRPRVGSRPVWADPTDPVPRFMHVERSGLLPRCVRVEQPAKYGAVAPENGTRVPPSGAERGT